MKYAYRILNELLARYNRSRHRKGDAKVNRSIRFYFEPNSFPEYFIDGLNNESDVINDEMKQLERQGLVVINWIEKEVLLQYVDINLNKIKEVHVLLGQESLNEVIQQRIQFLNMKSFELKTPWILRVIDRTLDVLKNQELPALAQDHEYLQLLISCFQGIEEKGEEIMPERFFSKRYLKDSKLFEKRIRSRLVTLYKQNYEGVSDWDEDDVLQEIGIVKSFEEMQVWGDLQYLCNGRILQFGNFPFGTTINADTIRTGEIIRIGHNRILIIENKSVYLEYVKRKQSMDELVVYVGGFPGPIKRKLFSQIHTWMKREKTTSPSIHFWGDIDLGGFRIFHHLQSLVLPMLNPFRMDEASLLSHLEWAEPVEQSYKKVLIKLRENSHMERFWPVIDEMINRNLRLEQEAFYVGSKAR